MVSRLLLVSILHLFLACAVLGQLGAERHTQASSPSWVKAGSLFMMGEGARCAFPEALRDNLSPVFKYPEFWET